MKAHKYFISFLTLFFLSLLGTGTNAGIFDNDTENWKRIFGEIKKINARLVTLEMGKLKSVQKTQEEQLRQIEELKIIIPELRGAQEQSQAQFDSKIDAMSQKLSDMETRLQTQKAEVLEEMRKHSESTRGIETGLATQFDQLKTHLAGDMETFAKTNQENFQGLSKSNSDSLAKVVEQLNTQNKNLTNVKEVFTSDLIPAITKQNEKNQEILISGLAKVNEKNISTMVAGFAEEKARNQKMIEILQQSFAEDQETKNNVELIGRNLGKTNSNIILNQETMVKLKDIIASQIDTIVKSQESVKAAVETDIKNTEIIHNNLSVADQKISVLADGFKTLNTESATTAAAMASIKGDVAANNAEVQDLVVQTGNKLAALTNATKELAARTGTQSGDVSQSFKKIEGQLASVDLANQKLSKLIEILKSMVAEQGKVDKVLDGQAKLSKTHHEIQLAQGQILKAQTEMQGAQKAIKAAQDRINKIQMEMKSQQGKIHKSQAEIKSGQGELKLGHSGIRKDQGESKKALADLARKANVNISRNDAIKKTLADMSKTSKR